MKRKLPPMLIAGAFALLAACSKDDVKNRPIETAKEFAQEDSNLAVYLEMLPKNIQTNIILLFFNYL